MENHPTRRYSRNHQKAIKFMLVSMVLGVLLIFTGIGWMVTAFKLSSTKEQFFSREVPIRNEESNADYLMSRVAALEQEVSILQEEKASLVRNRIPDLNPLTFDAILPIGQAYLKNIRFTQTGTEKNRKFEYLAVLQNNGQLKITPDVVILLFDSLGVQVGMAQLAEDDILSDATNDELEAGESRSYFSQIKLARERDPEYFHVEVK
ncbi:MAG: hypothetical protein ABR612_12385 [Chromatocurvus sp.]